MGQTAQLREPLRVRAGEKTISVDTPEMAVIAAQLAGLQEDMSIRWMDIEMQLLEAIEADDPQTIAIAMTRFIEAARASGKVL